MAWVVGLLVAYWALLKLQTLLIMVLVAFFLALAMEPGVDRLAQRGWRRGPATGLILGTVLVLGIGFLAAAGSVFVEQASDVVDKGPQYIRDIEEFLDDEFGISFDAEKVVREIENVPDATVASSAFDITLTAFEVLFEIVTVLVFAFFLAADGPQFRRAICSRLPRRRQEIVLETWELAVDRTGSYLWSRTILATISAIATYVFLLSLGIPNALALGIWVGVISQFIPTIGTYIAMVLPVVVALQDGHPIDALWVLVFLVGYQQIENYVLMPRITKRTMEVHPALAIGTVFAGGLLLGGVGAVLALPATAVIQSLVSAYTTEREVVDNPLVEEPPDKPSRWAAVRDRFLRRRNRDDDSDVE
jgi:predicted PurR-regulated permease PerM